MRRPTLPVPGITMRRSWRAVGGGLARARPPPTLLASGCEPASRIALFPQMAEADHIQDCRIHWALALPLVSNQINSNCSRLICMRYHISCTR